MQRKLNLSFTALLSLFTLFFVIGCNQFRPDNTITILAGSELKDMEPLLDEIENETGIRLQLEYIGTLDGTEQLLNGADYDLGWFSHAGYLSLLQGVQGVSTTQEKTMLSPVVLGIKASKAQAFGWVDNPNVTWQDIADKASNGELKYAMTNPTASNSGFTALIGVASGLSGSSDALRSENIDLEAMQGFFKGQALTAGSSGWLAESYVNEQHTLDGMINYESVLLALNENGRLQEDLVLIYPQEGIITADYPLILLNEEKREDYHTLVTFLRSPDFQEKLMRTTLRRPAVPGIALDGRIPNTLLIELPFPSTVDVIDNLLFSYLDEQRQPSHAYFVLDVSGSMKGEGLQELQKAMNNLTGVDNTLTGRFSRFRSREHVTVLTFNDTVQSINEFVIDDTNPDGADMQQIRNFVNELYPYGNTAIYTSLLEAYKQVQIDQQADPDHYYTIVLMSDGANTHGLNARDFENLYQALPADAQVRTFTVLFGEADEAAMQEIADITGGRMFDGKSESLGFIFKQIRGYQ